MWEDGLLRGRGLGVAASRLVALDEYYRGAVDYPVPDDEASPEDVKMIGAVGFSQIVHIHRSVVDRYERVA